MIESKYITANNIRQHYLLRNGGKKNALFIHGNGSDSIFWEELMNSMPKKYTCFAPDLRGFGLTEAVPALAVNSFGDFVHDLLEFTNVLGINEYTIFAHSLGGGISWELLLKDYDRIEELILVNPASPFGFGGTKYLTGELTFADGAGSGAGVVNPDFVERLKAGDRGTENVVSPMNVMNAFYWEPPFVPEDVDRLLDGLLRMRIGEEFYPGDHLPSENFPFARPGKMGQINCASPLTKTNSAKSLASLPEGIRVLWIRGGKDKIVSDESFFDTAVLGKMGMIPDYPGEEVCPPQPMVGQTRNVLEMMKADFKEVVMEDCGHSPYIEDLKDFLKHVEEFVNG